MIYYHAQVQWSPPPPRLVVVAVVVVFVAVVVVVLGGIHVFVRRTKASLNKSNKHGAWTCHSTGTVFNAN